MSSDLYEVLRDWQAEEIQVSVFTTLLAVEVLRLTVPDIPPERIEAIRKPLEGLYEMSRDSEEADDV
jgi:hypothetical protein